MARIGILNTKLSTKGPSCFYCNTLIIAIPPMTNSYLPKKKINPVKETKENVCVPFKYNNCMVSPLQGFKCPCHFGKVVIPRNARVPRSQLHPPKHQNKLK